MFREVGELRVKESDRLGLIAENLRAVGGRAAVVGRRPARRGRTASRRAGRCAPPATTGWPWRSPCSARCRAREVRVDDMACAAVSFPGFPETLARARAAGAGA